MYRILIRMKYGALVIIEGYDETTMFLEEHGDSIAYIIREEVRA